ncbi:MAG: FAD:protein FMN transferase [Spirochaetaceae bacterium]|jgi:thiamine biosynthesis lipoprotein|nr:FAD:protein FMN transferase [Spirochaetaceae bacterium]
MLPVRCFPSWAVFFIILAVFSACEKKQIQRTDFVLGTVCSIRFFKNVPVELFDSVFASLYELDDMLSANKAGNELDAVNKNAGLAPVAVRYELIEVLSRALYFASISRDAEGRAAFDPTIGALVKLWGIGGENQRVPAPDEIGAALALCNWRDVEINQADGTVFLKQKGMRLDLGAIAKGFAADKAAELIRSFGIERAIIDLGGNIAAIGTKPDGGAYRIGIQDPSRERGTYVGFVEVRNKTLVTSGTYERFFEEGGVRYHHILSSETGFPVQNGLLSVTIVGDSSMDADALSTTVFALGWEKGNALLTGIPGTEAIFIFDDGSVRTTSGVTLHQ